MNKPEKDSTSKTIEIEYTEQDVEEMREQGISEDELPRVGVHKFRRSRFVTERSKQKIKVSLFLDADILDFFKEIAEKKDGESFEKQINGELRQAMENRRQKKSEVVTLKMLENPEFLSSLAEKLKNAA